MGKGVRVGGDGWGAGELGLGFGAGGRVCVEGRVCEWKWSAAAGGCGVEAGKAAQAKALQADSSST